MRVLLLNGSPRATGCTYTALREVSAALNDQGVETEILSLGGKPVRDCIGCNGCAGKGVCIFPDDVVNQWIAKAHEADGFVFGSPVYYAHPTGQLLAVLDRLFYAGRDAFSHKPGAAVVSARRAGATASLDVLNRYFTNTQMPVVSSTYWCMVHGTAPAQVKQDLEGLQTMRNLGRNMAWILKCIQLGKDNGVAPPQVQADQRTDVIR